MSEDTSTSYRVGTELERAVTSKLSGRGGTIVIAIVVLALGLLMAFNMN